MKLNELKPAVTRRLRKRVGRGESSGYGKFSSRGSNGQKSRTGSSISPGFEGGQTPFFRRIPKKGFSNHPFKEIYAVVNVCDLEERYKDKETVNRESLIEKGLLKRKLKIKILGNGEITKSLKIDVDKISASAKEKILSAKGEIINHDQ